TGREIHQFQAKGLIYSSPAWSKDGARIALHQRSGDGRGQWARVWEVATGKELACWKADNVSLAADASTVALLDQTEEEETTSIGANIGNERVIKGKRCTIRVLDCLTSRELCRWNDANLAIGWSTLKRGSAEVSVPPFHTPDGRMLVSATGKNQVVRI